MMMSASGADRDDRDAVGDDRELHDGSLEPRQQQHDRREEERDAVAPDDSRCAASTSVTEKLRQ